MLKMHIIRTRITFKFMLWLAVPVGVVLVGVVLVGVVLVGVVLVGVVLLKDALVEVGVDPVIDRDVEIDTDNDVIVALLSDVFSKVNVPNLFRGLSLLSEPSVLFVSSSISSGGFVTLSGLVKSVPLSVPAS